MLIGSGSLSDVAARSCDWTNASTLRQLNRAAVRGRRPRDTALPGTASPVRAYTEKLLLDHSINTISSQMIHGLDGPAQRITISRGLHRLGCGAAPASVHPGSRPAKLSSAD